MIYSVCTSHVNELDALTEAYLYNLPVYAFRSQKIGIVLIAL